MPGFNEIIPKKHSGELFLQESRSLHPRKVARNKPFFDDKKFSIGKDYDSIRVRYPYHRCKFILYETFQIKQRHAHKK